MRPRIDMSAPRTRPLARPTKVAKARKREIETANLKIVDRMLAIAQVSSTQAKPTLTPPPETPLKSLNSGFRRRRNEAILRENQQLLRDLQKVHSTVDHKVLNSFAEQSQRYSRQISSFQQGKYTKDPLYPPMTPDLVRQVREQSEFWLSPRVGRKGYCKQRSLSPSPAEYSTLL